VISVPAVLLDWLFLGVALGLAVSVVVAGAFLAGRRAFPDPEAEGPSRSGDSRRRAEIRHYLRTIDEPFAENHPIEGHTVEFYLPKRDVAITFDARAFYGIDPSPTSPVLVEHEMPGVHLGSRLPFETPDLNFGDEADATDALDRTATAFAVLGLPTTADEKQIRAAYREKVKSVHPDQGGDPDEFKQLQEAYSAARAQAAD